MRLGHYSIHTERSYSDWIKRYLFFHHMISRDDLKDGVAKIEAFLTHLAVVSGVPPSTQNQAMNALIFLYKKVLMSGSGSDQAILLKFNDNRPNNRRF
jgi:hypothetical protein